MISTETEAQNYCRNLRVFLTNQTTLYSFERLMLEMAERNPRPRDLTILLLGVTGAGKSTLINMLANTLPGRKYQDQRLFAIPCTQEFEIQVDRRVLAWSRLQACNIEQFKELAAGDAADHRTSSPGIYRFRDTQTGRVVTLVDTPGLGDSRGEMFDELQTQTAVQAVLSVKQVDMVCVVHNATEARLRESTKTALARLREVLGPRAAAITTVCLTHSPKNIAPNCIDALKEAGLPTDNLFRFENSCLVHPDLYSQLCKQELGADHEEAQELAEIGARSWTHNERAAKQLLDRAANSETLDAIYILSNSELKKLFGKICRTMNQNIRNTDVFQILNKIHSTIRKNIENGEPPIPMPLPIEPRLSRKSRLFMGISTVIFSPAVYLIIKNAYNTKSINELYSSLKSLRFAAALGVPVLIFSICWMWYRQGKNKENNNPVQNRIELQLRNHVDSLVAEVDEKLKILKAVNLSSLFMTKNKHFKLGFMWSLKALQRTDPTATDLFTKIEEAGCYNDIEVDRRLMGRLTPLWTEYIKRESKNLERTREGLKTAKNYTAEIEKTPAAELSDEQRRILADAWREQMETDAQGTVQVPRVRESLDPFVIDKLQT